MMTTFAPTPMTLASGRSADDLAIANARTNRASLAITQPKLSDHATRPVEGVTWTFARDGSLTAMLEGERWWAGCSVPRAAARFMLKAMDVRGTLGCFLHPSHAAQLRVALDRLHSRQAIVAIVPEEQTLTVLLHADDFSRDIAAGRLWFAAGSEWQAELEAIFERNPGLPTPVEFVRPILADTSPADQLIEPAQTIFARVSQARTARVQSLNSGWKSRDSERRRVCLLAGSEFRLWDDAAIVLADLASGNCGLVVDRIDPDRPTSASPLALADAAAQCDAILAANCFRHDLPGITPIQQPWATWVTTSRIPSAADAGPNDRLLLADPSFRAIAARQGWPADRIQLAGWPEGSAEAPSPDRGFLSIIADTQPLDMPKQVGEYSSQSVLWELIRDELTRDPFLATGDMGQYLKSRRSRLQIGESGFDAGTFVDRLMIPCIHQSIAKLLIGAGLPVRLFGRGWDQIEGLAEHHGGVVSSRDQLSRILGASAAVVHLWPWETAHPIEWAGRPLVRANGATQVLHDARIACSRPTPRPRCNAPSIAWELVANVLK
jgi:hypothetical protein